jgi:hypothetical protein
VDVTIEQAEAVGLCWECGYSLRGLEQHRCPECGRPFDPADPATMNMGREVGGLAGWLLRPPGWQLYTMTAVAVLLSLWAAAAPTAPGQIYPHLRRVWVNAVSTSWVDELVLYRSVSVRYAYAVLAWGVVAVVWIVRRVARGAAVRRIAPGQRAAPFAYWRRWLMPHFVLAATVLFCLTHGPVYLGFWASKPFVDTARRNWPGNPTTQQLMTQASSMRRGKTRWIGVYPVEKFGGLWEAPRFPIPTSGSNGMNLIQASDDGGFVYSPDRAPVGFSSYDVKYVGGGWYSFHRADVYR